jgi:hypothetical protein
MPPRATRAPGTNTLSALGFSSHCQAYLLQKRCALRPANGNMSALNRKDEYYSGIDTPE